MAFESLKSKAPSDATSTPAKKPKLRSMAPPGEAEATGTERGRKASRARAKAKKEAAAKKTTAKAKASATNANGGKAANGGTMAEKAGVTKNAKPAKPKAPSVYDAALWGFETGMGIQALLKNKNKKKGSEQSSVLMRPTIGTAKFRDRFVGKKTGKEAKKAIEAKFGKIDKVFRVMDLPKELRTMVWRHAVVCDDAFITPQLDTSREQPDLAMTCRQVREEVLPIFYGENMFSIDISLSTPAFHTPVERLFQKWGGVLRGSVGKPGTFSMIRKWVFSYSSIAVFGLGQGFVVALNFAKKQVAGGISWDANIEVHRRPCCVIPTKEEFGMCHVETVPESLNEPIISITERAKGGHITLDMIRELITKIRSEAAWTAMHMCEDPSVSASECLTQATFIKQIGNPVPAKSGTANAMLG